MLSSQVHRQAPAAVPSAPVGPAAATPAADGMPGAVRAPGAAAAEAVLAPNADPAPGAVLAPDADPAPDGDPAPGAVLAPGAARAPGLARTSRRLGALGLLLVGLAGAVLLSLAVGSRSIPLGDVLLALTAPDGSQDAAVVRELRLPRTVVALVVGAALGLAGAQLQGLTRNPLADPSLLGVSAGAALGIVAAGTFWDAGRPVAAVAGALAAIALVYSLAGSGRSRSGVLSLVLAGVAVTALLSALTTILVLLDADTLDEYRFWVVGAVAGRDPDLLLGVAPLLVAGLLLAAVGARTLNLLALGTDLARGLGAQVGRGTLGVVLSATLLTAGAVAVAGPLTFVGLLVPHLARVLVGTDHRWSLPVSAVAGAGFVVLCDVAGRVLARPGELQVGIVTALAGVPVLIALARRNRRPA